MSTNRPKPSRWRTGLTVAVLLILAAFALRFVNSAEQSAAADHSPAPPCPEGFVDRVGDADRIRQRLEGTPEGHALLNALRREIRFCFGEIDVPVVSQGRVLVLDDRTTSAEQSSRVGHLLHHVVEGMPFPDEVAADTDCDAVVDTAMDREAEAYSLEVELRRTFGLGPTRYDFEPAYWRVPESERVALVGRYLREHGDGARNMDGLAAGYYQRCEVERADAAE